MARKATTAGTTKWYEETQKDPERAAGADQGKRLMRLFYSSVRRRLAVEHPDEYEKFKKSQYFRVGAIMNLFWKYLVQHEMELTGDMRNAGIATVARIPSLYGEAPEYIYWHNGLSDIMRPELYVAGILNGAIYSLFYNTVKKQERGK